MDNDIVFFGETNFRNKRIRFGIRPDDRRRHMYIIGKTGMGKTELLKNMAIQDIQLGHGMAFVDPHGDTADSLLDYVPADRIKDVIYFDPSDIDHPIGFNIMEQVGPDHRHLVASGVMGVFKKVWVDVWSARMEYILNNTILALLEYPGSTLLGVNRMLADKDYRKQVIEKVTDPVVKAFWVQEFARYTDRLASEATAAIQNKVGQFTSATLIRNIIGQEKSKLNMREIIDSGKILILNLSKGKIGEDTSRLLGALMVTRLQLAAMSRVDVLEAERKDFFLYVDEFQNFATESFANILSEARKYRLSLILAHQYVAQMDEKVRDAVFGNVGTLISFRVGAEDAEIIEKEFAPEFTVQDLVNLGKWTVYLKLMIDGVTSRAFSAITLPPMPPEEVFNRDLLIEASRQQYASTKQAVEDEINKWAVATPGAAIKPHSEDSRFNVDRPRPGMFAHPRPELNRSRPDLDRPRRNFREDYNRPDREYSKPKTRTISLDEAFSQGPVDFKGRKIQEERKALSTPKETKKADPIALRKVLEEALKK